MVDNSGLVGGGSGKSLILPKVEGRRGAISPWGEFISSNSDITGYGVDKSKAIPLFLPDITNAARDFTTTGNLTYGGAMGTNNGYKPVVYEQSFRNFTIDTGHQVTMLDETISIIRASEAITIGGNGVTTTKVFNSGVLLGYPYDHATLTLGAQSNKAGGGGNGVNNGGGQPQRTTTNFGTTGGGDAGGFGSAAASVRAALILIANTITINGDIDFSGNNATAPGSTSGGEGGGHGGYVYLIANTINYTGGTINVSGGNASNGGTGADTGGGGGGHCGMLYTHARNYVGSGTTITAVGGTAGTGNGAGFAGSDGGYPYPTMSTGEYRIEGKPF